MNSMFVECDLSVSWRKTFLVPSVWTEAWGPWLEADWNSGKHCTACRLARRCESGGAWWNGVPAHAPTFQDECTFCWLVGVIKNLEVVITSVASLVSPKRVEWTKCHCFNVRWEHVVMYFTLFCYKGLGNVCTASHRLVQVPGSIPS
jgi:hypothetical protein